MKAKALLSASFILLLVFLSSCRERNEPSKDVLVPDEMLVKILTDIYLGEGLMDMKEVKDMYGHRDSLANFQDISKKYGYTYLRVDSTIKYYFLFKPRKLEKIYDKVTGNLLEIEATVNSENTRGPISSGLNLWNGRTSYSYPDESFTDPVAFNIPVDKPGLYTFKTLYQLFSDDESIDPEVIIYFSSVDEFGKEVRINWDVHKLKKDGKFHSVYLQKEIENTENTSIKGWLFSHSNTGTDFKKHARIRDISFTLRNKPQKEKR